MLLCDAAQQVGGKLYVLGGGWTHILFRGQSMNMALAVVLAVPWDRTNERLDIETTLRTEDGEPVRINEVVVGGTSVIEVGRPPGIKAGSEINAAFVVNFEGLVLDPGGYVWDLRLAEESLARTPFWVVAPPEQQA
jgi:hypothetical protein